VTTRNDVIVIGGGIVGLATALHLLQQTPGRRLVVIEKEQAVAQHQTGHNSGVIHSGLYYRPGSLKARLCVEGYNKLLDFCRKEQIPHEVCGKVVVALADSQVPQLDELERRGSANGLGGLRRLTPTEIREREPHCAGVAGLFVPHTGIVDYVAVAEAMARHIRSLGGDIRLGEAVVTISPGEHEVRVHTTCGEHTCKFVVTCGGLQSDRLTRQTVGDLDLRILPFRGEYYTLRDSARHLVRHLIYPVPDPSFPFLGVHFTRMIDGAVECGPNAVLAFAREGYTKTTVRPGELVETLTWPGFRKVARKYWRTGLGEYQRSFSKRAFVRALQRLVPEVTEGDLVPAPAGVRAQACDRDGNLLDDFAIRETARVFNVCNAPSPAATASLAIGSYLASRVAERFEA
jgi:L-2-hydroxyglutarate oxidase